MSALSAPTPILGRLTRPSAQYWTRLPAGRVAPCAHWCHPTIVLPCSVAISLAMAVYASYQPAGGLGTSSPPRWMYWPGFCAATEEMTFSR
ncbi:hypothetical protein D3C74_300430 [compost metagenome]